VSTRAAVKAGVGVQRRAAPPCGLASRKGASYLNDSSGLAVTAVAVMLSIRPAGDGITFHACDLDLDG